jgi:hypothetical protein
MLILAPQAVPSSRRLRLKASGHTIDLHEIHDERN